MSKYLVIVESPTKAKTIVGILSKDFEVASSMGHIIDLPSNCLAIDIEKGFVPSYKVIRGKEKILLLLKKKAKNKEAVYIATDPDREGEAIGWHIKNSLAQENDKFYRVVFHEITEEAVKEAFTSPRELDTSKINAQQARRLLDRIVGYYLSPFLWKKVVRGLSAGRVQSVALRFIVEREEEIKRFVPKTTYGIEANFRVNKDSFKAKLVSFKGKKGVFERKEEAEEAIAILKQDRFLVKDIKKKKTKRKPPPPFTTSLLQQEAFNKLKFTSKKTMLIAQRLYEGVEINKEMVGLITYMRTDSFRIADKAKLQVKGFIKERWGEDYLPEKEYKYKEKKGAQLAHEAIRPTAVDREPLVVEKYLTSDEVKLYTLIWKRFVASFMKEAVFEDTKVEIGGKAGIFVSEGREVIFDGFLKLGDRGETKFLPSLEKGEEVILENIRVVEHTTKPPPRFTDASLVKLLEEKGIGRPSTYAPTISTLILRNYIKREKGQFVPTELGKQVCELLIKYFPDIMDDNFTACLEEKLDSIEEGKVEWKKILEEFYPPFKEKVEEAYKVVKKTLELVDKKCPQCNRPLCVRWSRKGKFLSCSGFPECKYAESITTNIPCPQCGKGELIERRNKRGQRFYGCTKFPECKYTTRELPTKRERS